MVLHVDKQTFDSVDLTDIDIGNGESVMVVEAAMRHEHRQGPQRCGGAYRQRVNQALGAQVLPL
jgi:hypothetical protein